MDGPGDVAERRRASAAHVRSILDNALDAVVALDAAGRVRFWNPCAERTFGWSREDALGRPFVELALAAGSRERLRADLEGMAAAAARIPSVRIEVEGRRNGGEAFPLELTVSTIPHDPDYRFSLFARDVTERRRAENERDQLLVEAEAARAHAETASRVKDEFLATLSHELRTPLTTIVGWVYLLKSGQLDGGAVARGLEAIDRNAAAQAQVIDDIVDLSRMVGANLRLNLRPLQLAPVVAAGLDPLVSAAAARNIRLTPILDPTAGLVSGDTDRLRQVVWNLVSNAVKFTDPGGRVTVRLRRDGDWVEIRVEDTGRGIAPDVLPHVFERFRQGDSSNTRSYGGLGLGLAVVRHLVELHGGHVRAESPGEGQGATFTVTLPRLGDPQGEDAAGREASLQDAALPDGVNFGLASARLDGVRVLVVDASPDVGEVIAAILRQAGATVETASDARQAMAAIARATPDVLLSELEMAGETGYSLIRRVRELPADAGGSVPAAALTTFSRTEDRVQALLGGFQLHLAKPVQPAELLAVVASLSRRGRGSPPRAPDGPRS